MAIEFDDLQLVLEIVDLGSFSQAAARRRWSQPQVSQRVGALEGRLGVSLFRRHRRGAVPTDACIAFLPAARDALAALEAGLHAVRVVPDLPKLTLACLPSLAATVFGRLLPALATANLEVRCTTDHSPIIMEMLLTDRAQFGFVLKGPAVPGVRQERLCISPVVAIVRAGHPLALLPKPTLADLANVRLAPQYWGNETEDLLALLRAQRTVAEPIHTIQPASAALDLVLEHGFLSFVPAMVAAQHMRSGHIVELTVPDLPRWNWELMVAWRTGKRPDPAKQTVLRQIRAMAQDWSGLGRS